MKWIKSIIVAAAMAASVFGGEVVYVLMDAADENFACQELLDSNVEQVKSFVAKKIHEGDVDRVIVGVFAKDSELVYAVEPERRYAEGLRKKRFGENVRGAIHDVVEKIAPRYHRGIIDGKERLYPRDVYGALEMVLDFIRENGDENATVVVASTMVQGYNRKEVKAKVQKEPLQLPEGVKVVVFGKAFVCRDAASMKKREALRKTRAFWLEHITGDVVYKQNY